MKKITEADVARAKEVIEMYHVQQHETGEGEQPYKYSVSVEVNENHEYNPNYGDNRECKCGHPYYRHFDTYEEMQACGCKYCDCFDFEEVGNVKRDGERLRELQDTGGIELRGDDKYIYAWDTKNEVRVSRHTIGSDYGKAYQRAEESARKHFLNNFRL